MSPGEGNEMTDRQNQLGLIAFGLGILLACLPSAAWAHGDFGPLGAAIFIGPVLGLIVTVLLPIKRLWLKCLAFFPVAAVCMFASGVVAALMSEADTRKHNAAYLARVAGFDADPIAQAACVRDAARVKALTSAAVSDEQQTRFGEVLARCAMGPDPENAEIFGHLMPKIMSMQHGTSTTGVLSTHGYCDVLQIVHSQRLMPQLKTLVDQKLPISCVTTMGRQVWWDSVNLGLSSTVSATTTEAMTEWLTYLKDNGVALGEQGGKNPYGGAESMTLINLVIQQGSFEMIMLGLNAGGDTNLVDRPALHINAPIELWTVRRFKDNNGLSAAQTQEVQSRFGELTAEQANRTKSGNGSTLLWDLAQLQNNADGGAAFFAYLVSRGADLSARDHWGTSALFDLQTTSPALLAEFDKLSPQQFKALMSPMDGPKSVLASAQRKSNTALVNYLCAKGAKCS
jgi:hypothetical protein